MLRSISDLHFTGKSRPRAFQFACGIAPSQVRDAIRRARTRPRLESAPAAAGSPHSKNPVRQAPKDLCASNVLLKHSDIFFISSNERRFTASLDSNNSYLSSPNCSWRLIPDLKRFNLPRWRTSARLQQSALSRQAQQSGCAVAVLPVHDDQRSAVGFGNLTA